MGPSSAHETQKDARKTHERRHGKEDIADLLDEETVPGQFDAVRRGQMQVVQLVQQPTG